MFEVALTWAMNFLKYVHRVISVYEFIFPSVYLSRKMGYDRLKRISLLIVQTYLFEAFDEF